MWSHQTCTINTQIFNPIYIQECIPLGRLCLGWGMAGVCVVGCAGGSAGDKEDTDRRLWKHVLTATSFAGGNRMYEEVVNKSYFQLDVHLHQIIMQ